MTTQLQPGQIVQHPELGYGIFVSDGMETGVSYDREGSRDTRDLTGWIPVEAIKPGHVQVRVDDLDPKGLQRLGNREEYPNTKSHVQWNAATRVGRAWAESHTEPASAETVAENGAPKLTSANVSLPCPECGEILSRKAEVWSSLDGQRVITWLDMFNDARHWHTCEPEQPVEPTEFGDRVTVTTSDGTREPWLRCVGGPFPWASEASNFPCEWDELTDRGTVSIGWGDAK